MCGSQKLHSNEGKTERDVVTLESFADISVNFVNDEVEIDWLSDIECINIYCTHYSSLSCKCRDHESRLEIVEITFHM